MLTRAFKIKGKLNNDKLLALFKEVYRGQEWICNHMRNNWKTSKTLWYQDKGFLTNLDNLLDKINYIKEGHTLVEYAAKYNENVYERFYVNDIDKYAAKMFWLIQKIHNKGKDEMSILSEYLSVDFGDLYNELLFDHGFEWWRIDKP